MIKSIARKSFVRGQMCFVHPPTPDLAGASHSYDYVSIILEGATLHTPSLPTHPIPEHPRIAFRFCLPSITQMPHNLPSLPPFHRATPPTHLPILTADSPPLPLSSRRPPPFH